MLFRSKNNCALPHSGGFAFDSFRLPSGRRCADTDRPRRRFQQGRSGAGRSAWLHRCFIGKKPPTHRDSRLHRLPYPPCPKSVRGNLPHEQTRLWRTFFSAPKCVESIISTIFVSWQQTGLSLILLGMRGKSGQHRAPSFLTGSCLRGQSNVAEKNRRAVRRGKGEKTPTTTRCPRVLKS